MSSSSFRANKRVRQKILLSSIISSFIAAQAFAQEADESQALPKVVVSASGFEQKVKDAPASVTVVGEEELKSKPYTSLADALRDVEGIDVGTGLDKNGNISITLRGLPADYTVVMIDGRRQSDIGNLGPNNFGNSQFMYMPPLSAIERIEVVRGPMSTLYGADAIGGVVNIITRKVPQKWGGSLDTSVTLQQDSQYGDDKKLDVYLGGPIVTDRVGISLRGGIYERDPSDPSYSNALPLPATDVDGNPNEPVWIDEGSFGDKKIVAAKNWNFGSTLNWLVAKGHELSLTYDVAKQRYDNTQGQTGTLDSAASLWRASNQTINGVSTAVVQPRVGYTPYQRVEREQLSLSHTGKYDFGSWVTTYTYNTSANLGRSLPLTVEERTRLQEIWNDNCPTLAACRSIPNGVEDVLNEEFLPRPLRTLEIVSHTLDTRVDTSIGDAHAVSIGGQYYDTEMEDGVFGMFGGGYRSGTVQPHRQSAIFVEDHWALSEELIATLGLRYDHHNTFGGNSSPRVYLTWQTNDWWTLKGGVSTGYKAPRPDQLFEGIVGFGGQGVSPFVGTPDLKPESSRNYEVAVYFDNLNGFNANATFFYNDFEDKIASAEGVPNCYNASDVKHLSGDCVDIGPGWAALGYATFGQSTNIDEVITSGLELSTRYAFAKSWAVKANYTLTESEQRSGEDRGLPLVNTPRNMFNGAVEWQATEDLSLSLVAEMRSKRFRAAPANASGERIPSYFKAYELYHLRARYKLNENLSLGAAINNLLDDDLSSITYTLNDAQNGYNRQPDYNTTEKARSFWLSANISF
ncbi:MAG: TonB-dependent receptor [Cellvibrionaceae bacterium]|nr:TonB-dependent receptor [Cellvibrionaceae bacterium]